MISYLEVANGSSKISFEKYLGGGQSSLYGCLLSANEFGPTEISCESTNGLSSYFFVGYCSSSY